MPSPEALRAQVLARWGSVHAFCRAHPELTRSAVYMTLAGTYAGDEKKQCALIAAALAAPPQQEQAAPSAITLAANLQRVRCSLCRKQGKRQCRRCRARTAQEAQQLFLLLYS